MRRTVLVAVLVAAIVFLVEVTAEAQPAPPPPPPPLSSTLGDGGITTTGSAPGGERVEHAVVDSTGRRIVRTYTKVDDWGCSGDPGTGLQGWGRTAIRTRDATTGEQIQYYTYCGEPPEGSPGSPAAPPAPPPLPEEVWQFVPLPTDEVNINPRVRGLVGLETWLWYDEGMTVDVPPVTIRGWSVTTEVWVSEICWDMGYETDDFDGNDHLADEDVRCSTQAGTEDNPSTTWVYQWQCNECTVSMTVTWTGRYTVTGPLFPTGQTFEMGTETVSAERLYDVIEVEAVGSD
ncbi:MAG: hypothetical protein ACRD29_08180 [Acidimicrobiales bacterium]